MIALKLLRRRAVELKLGAKTAQKALSQRRRYSSVPTQKSSSGVPTGWAIFGGLVAGAIFTAGFFKYGTDREIKVTTKLKDSSTTSRADLDSPQYCNDEEFAKGVAEIAAILDKLQYTKDDVVLESYSDTFFSTHHPPNPKKNKPGIVVYPNSTEDVSKIMKIAHKYSIPVVPTSGLTSLEGHNMHTRGRRSIAMSFANMDNIVAFHPEDLDIVVQPGVGWQDLDDYLTSTDEGSRFLFGPDPGIGACIGGMVGTSASGTNAFRYGTMKESVVNLTVVLADGTVVKTRQRPRKSSAGYDLTHIFIGSEGTLGVVTEITLKLSARPIKEYVSMAAFPSLEDAGKTAQTIIRSGIQPNAIEILDATTMSFVNQTAPDGAKKFLEKTTLFFKTGGHNDVQIKEQVDFIRNAAQENNLISFETSSNEEDNKVLWYARRNGLFSTIEYGGKVLPDPNDVQVWVTDIAVPISKLADVIQETGDDLQRSGFKGRYSLMGHIGDGNCHFIIIYNSPDYAKVQEVVDRMVYRALDFEGTCTGEHGVGVGKRKYLYRELGESSVDLMRQLKFLLDPKRILNPDKIFEIDAKDNLEELLSEHHIKVNTGCSH